MNDEPTYTFVRGQGWIPEVARRHLCIDGGGRKVWLVDRKPRKGERYIAKSKRGSMRARYWDLSDRTKPDFRKFEQRVVRWKRFEDFSCRVSNRFSEDMFYLTVELAGD